MKRRTLFLTTPLFLCLALFLFLNRSVQPEGELAQNNAEAKPSKTSVADRDDRLRAMEDATYVEEELEEELNDAADSRIVQARQVVPQNLSGVALDNIPAGVSRIEEVLFESQVADGKGIRRSRVLKTDFHYPLVQTLEMIERNPESGEEEVIAYQSMVADHVLVQLDLERAPEQWEDLLATRGLEIRKKITDHGLYTLMFEVEGADPVATVVESLQNENDWVEYAEPDMVVASRSHDPIPNDEFFDFQWGLRNTGEIFGGTPGADINAVDGWAVQQELQEARGEEPAPGRASWLEGDDEQHVIVAVLDTGINYKHLDLAGNMWVNPRESRNFFDDDGNGFVDDIHGVSFVWNDGDPMDFNGHGTHVAGTIGAMGNNQRGVAGVAWDVKLMGVQFLNSFGGGVLSDSILATDYSWQNGAHVLNNSWGFDAYGRWLSSAGPSSSLAGAIQRARDAGAIFVTAAGNDSDDVDIFPSFPADHQRILDNIVNVGSMEPSGNRSVWLNIRFISFFFWEPDFFFEIGSNFGEEQVQVFAPGSAIFSTYIGGNNDAYAALSGTSMAAPHVAGMYAILKAEYPNEPYEVLIHRLLERADSEPQLAGFGQEGRMANLARALDPAPLIFRPLENQEFQVDGPISLVAKVSASGDPQEFRLLRDGVEIISTSPVPAADGRGVITLTHDIANATSFDAGVYRLEVTSAHGTSASVAEVRPVAGVPEIGTSLGAPFLAWRTDGDEPWILDADGARSGVIGDGEFTQLSTTVTGPGKLTFSWEVSSEELYDRGRFLINGETEEEISGESGWLPREIDLPPGNHELLWVYFKDASGFAGDDALRLADVDFVSDHPLIVEQSHSGFEQVAVGGNIELSFDVTGADPLTYYWKKDEKLISGVNEPTLTLNNVQPSDAGTYVGVVANSHGADRTVPVTLDVVASAMAPQIVQHPQSFMGFSGASMSISAAWTATHPDTAQWHKDGEPLSGQTDSVLSLSNLSEEDSGKYTLVVSNEAGQAESHPAMVQVYPSRISFSEYSESLSGAGDEASSDEALLRFALGLDAVTNEAEGHPKLVLERDYQVGIASESGATGTVGDPAFPALEFNRPINATGVRYILEASDDLRNWKEVEATMEPAGEPQGLLQKVRLREVQPVPDGQKRRFLRLRLEIEE